MQRHLSDLTTNFCSHPHCHCNTSKCQLQHWPWIVTLRWFYHQWCPLECTFVQLSAGYDLAPAFGTKTKPFNDRLWNWNQPRTSTRSLLVEKKSDVNKNKRKTVELNWDFCADVEKYGFQIFPDTCVNLWFTFIGFHIDLIYLGLSNISSQTII